MDTLSKAALQKDFEWGVTCLKFAGTDVESGSKVSTGSVMLSERVDILPGVEVSTEG